MKNILKRFAKFLNNDEPSSNMTYHELIHNNCKYYHIPSDTNLNTETLCVNFKWLYKNVKKYDNEDIHEFINRCIYVYDLEENKDYMRNEDGELVIVYYKATAIYGIRNYGI